MAMKDNFLREVKIGDTVELMIGPKEMTGIVVALDLDTVRIRKENGKEPVLSLNSISYYEVGEGNQVQKVTQTSASESENMTLTQAVTTAVKEVAAEVTGKTGMIQTIVPVESPSMLESKYGQQAVVFDFNAIESRGLIFETGFWNENIKLLSITPTIKELIKTVDQSNELMNSLNSLLGKLAYCVKINEIDPKFGRIQPVIFEINRLCERYNSDFLFELLAIILIQSGATYKEYLKKICTNRVIRLGDAVVCYQKKRFEEMAYYCSDFYANVKLTEQNFDNFLFIIPYFVKYGHVDIIQKKRNEIKSLSEFRQMSFATVYNNAITSSSKSQTQMYTSSRIEECTQMGGTSTVSKVMVDELKDKVEKLVRSGNYTQAYNLVEKKFKENPENETLSELLQYVGRVKSNSLKYKNLPNDGTFYSKALRDWHIYEDLESAKKNFVHSINRKENRYFSAIMDYVDLIMHTDGETAAINKLMSYKDIIRTLDSESRIKYFEKLTSLYTKGKDYDNLMQCLNSLKDLYKTRVKRTSGNKAAKEKSQAKVAITLFRISQCQYAQGKYRLSINTAKEAIESGQNLNSCVNQIVSCYLIQNDYELARKTVKEYMVKDYNLVGLFEKIDTLEEAFNSKNTEGHEDNTPVDVYELLGFDNEFINYYESSCGFEGISEDRKISKDFTEDDLGKIENEIKHTSKTKPKDRADYYLTAACIEKSLNDRSDKYYGFIANSMLYHGHLLLANRDFDCAKSFYLSAISMSLMSSRGVKVEQDAICGYMYCSLKQAKTQASGEIMRFESELMIITPKISELLSKDNAVLFDVVRLLNVSRKLKEFFTKNSNQSICKNILDAVMKMVSWNRVDEQLWVRIGKTYKGAENTFNKWYSEVQLDKNFEHDIDYAVEDVIKSLLVTNIDIEYIKKYQECYKDVREYTEFTDFDNRIRVLNQGMNAMQDLMNLGHKNSTLFFENYLQRVIRVTISNLNAIIQHTGEDYKPELNIEVPITNIPIDNGYVSLSVTISNADNKATARNISITILGLNQEELCKMAVENNNLKGGASISELARIPVDNEEAFTITVLLNYVDDENESYAIEKQISISTNAEDFERIRNPYITGKPVVNDDMFFGREALVQRLVNAISDDQIRCIIIYGQKRTGKSSIFDHLKRRLTNHFIVLNFSVGADITSERNFYKSVQKELVEYLEDNNFDDNVIKTFDDYQIVDFIDFEKFIGKANRSISKPAGKELLLMIDEFTHIYTYIKDSNYDIGENFMDKWKAMIEKDLFKSALIGQDFMPDFIQEYANQFQVTDPIYVSYLERKDAIDLVISPIKMKDGSNRFLENSEEMIVDWFNGQPYYLQCYCSKLVNYINEEQKQNYVTTAVARKVKDAMLSSVQLDFFDNLVRIDETDLLEVLLKIAQASDNPGTKIRVDRLRLNDKQQKALEKMATRGVVDYIKSEQKCCITIPFFHEWLRQSY